MNTLGSLRGTIEDGAVNITSGGFPQLVLKLSTAEMYDESAKEWAAWEEFWDEGSKEINDRTMFAYLVLFGEKGATFNVDQVKAITGWEGDSLTKLNAMDLAGMPIQWRNTENTYEGKTNVQVAFIDEYDAAPGGSVKKIDAKEIAGLDAKFAEYLTGANKPESKKSTRGAKKTGEAPKEETVDDTPKEGPKTTGRRGRKPAVTKTEATGDGTVKNPRLDTGDAPTPPEADDIPFDGVEPCTKQEAWNAVCEGKKADVTVDQLTQVWQKTLANVALGKKQVDLTGEEWSAVRAGVLDDVA